MVFESLPIPELIEECKNMCDTECEETIFVNDGEADDGKIVASGDKIEVILSEEGKWLAYICIYSFVNDERKIGER